MFLPPPTPHHKKQTLAMPAVIYPWAINTYSKNCTLQPPLAITQCFPQSLIHCNHTQNIKLSSVHAGTGTSWLHWSFPSRHVVSRHKVVKCSLVCLPYVEWVHFQCPQSSSALGLSSVFLSPFKCQHLSHFPQFHTGLNWPAPCAPIYSYFRKASLLSFGWQPIWLLISTHHCKL